MNKFKIITDSSCDLTAELAEQLEIDVLCLSVLAEDKVYKNYLDGREISPTDYYKMLRDGLMAKTAAANIEDFTDIFTKWLDEGYDVIYLGFSSALSGTFNTGKIVADEMREKYPDRKIYCVDTLSASLGQGMMVYYAANMQKSGASIDEVRDWVEENKISQAHLFTVNDLHHLHRGGRVSKTTAIIGSALGVKPLMHCDNEGKLVKTGVVRGRQASLDALVKKMKETIINAESQTVFISHGDCIDDAEYVKSEILKALPVKEVVINFVGPVIGTHSGPGTMALFFFASVR